ncbi:MAG: DUF2397 family protein, partial [Acidimicrobiales bacterium]
ARGRSARGADHGEQKRHLLALRAAEDERRAAACAELLAVAGRLGEARLSAAAMTVLLELLANAAVGGRAALPDHPVAVSMTAAPGVLVIRSDTGSLAIEGRHIVISAPGADDVRSEDEEAV